MELKIRLNEAECRQSYINGLKTLLLLWDKMPTKLCDEMEIKTHTIFSDYLLQ